MASFFFLLFLALMGYLWGQGMIQKLICGLLLYLILTFDFDFDLILGSFFNFLCTTGQFLGWPYWAIFGVWAGYQNSFTVSSCSWTTFIFFVSFNSDFWFWLSFGVSFCLLFGSNGQFLGRERVQKLFWGLFI